MAAAHGIRVAVVGAGRWAQVAHIPGWQRDPRAEVVALADVDEAALAAAADKFSVPRTTTDYRELLDDPDIDVVDVVTGNQPHFQISWDALSAGKHVLCEKPVHYDYRKTRQAAELAAAKGLRTKLGFTFRYAPAVMYAKELIDSGFVGEPYIFNGYEQNSQWIDPATPLRQFDPDADPSRGGRVLDRGLRRPDHRHHALVAGPAADRGGRRHAQLRAGARDPRHRPDDPGQHRRRRHVDRRVRPRRAGLDPVLLRDRRQLPGHRGPNLRLRGRADHPAGRRVRDLPDDQDRDQGRGRVRRAGDPGPVLPARRPAPASRGTSCSTPTWSPTSPARSSIPAGPARATSPRARSCRRPSTRSRRPTGPAPG